MHGRLLDTLRTDTDKVDISMGSLELVSKRGVGSAEVNVWYLMLQLASLSLADGDMSQVTHLVQSKDHPETWNLSQGTLDSRIVAEMIPQVDSHHVSLRKMEGRWRV